MRVWRILDPPEIKPGGGDSKYLRTFSSNFALQIHLFDGPIRSIPVLKFNRHTSRSGTLLVVGTALQVVPILIVLQGKEYTKSRGFCFIESLSTEGII
jgi:hypothetical protein